MKSGIWMIVASMGLVLTAWSAPVPMPAAGLGHVDTNWSGLEYQISFIKHIPPGRLLVGVRVHATAAAAPGGTVIGFIPTMPTDATRAEKTSGLYLPRPLSLASVVMTEDLTKQTYPVLTPIAPPGRGYRSGSLLATLMPGQSQYMTIQFAVPPPPPPPPNGGPPPVQTVSFTLPNAKGPILKVPLPAPTSASTSAN